SRARPAARPGTGCSSCGRAGRSKPRPSRAGTREGGGDGVLELAAGERADPAEREARPLAPEPPERGHRRGGALEPAPAAEEARGRRDELLDGRDGGGLVRPD